MPVILTASVPTASVYVRSDGQGPAQNLSPRHSDVAAAPRAAAASEDPGLPAEAALLTLVRALARQAARERAAEFAQNKATASSATDGS